MYQGGLSTPSVSLRASWNFPKRFSGQGASHPGCGRQRDPSKQNINGPECSQISGEAAARLFHTPSWFHKPTSPWVRQVVQIREAGPGRLVRWPAHALLEAT